MKGTLNYREKCWAKSLDMINNNRIKMYSTQGEFEGTLKSIGKRQNDLIKKMSLSMEWYAFNRSEKGSSSKQPQVQIHEFSPSAIGYKVEAINLHSSPSHDRRRKSLAL